MDRAQKFAGCLLYDGRSSANVSHGPRMAIVPSVYDQFSDV